MKIDNYSEQIKSCVFPTPTSPHPNPPIVVAVVVIVVAVVVVVVVVVVFVFDDGSDDKLAEDVSIMSLEDN